MKPPKPFCSFVALVFASLGVSPVVLSQQDAPSATQLNTAASYPNSPDGLHQLLNDLLLAAKNNDLSKLGAQIGEMKIPSYESWFTSTFGQENGERLSAMYGKSLQVSELHFEMLWTELAKQQGEILIEKVDVTKRYATLTGRLDEYTANWKKTDDSAGPDGQPVGTFYFVDGEFRLNASFQGVRVLSNIKSGSGVPAKLINRVQPEYPEAARQLKIQGTVSINVIVRKDGSVTVQNVGAGIPLLDPAAVAAVQQWRYQPTTVNGEPVDVQTKVYVVFALTNPSSQQK